MLTGVVLASCYCRNGVVRHSVVHTCAAAAAVRKRIVVFAGTLWRSRAIVMLTGIEVVAVVRGTDKVRKTFVQTCVAPGIRNRIVKLADTLCWLAIVIFVWRTIVRLVAFACVRAMGRK